MKKIALQQENLELFLAHKNIDSHKSDDEEEDSVSEKKTADKNDFSSIEELQSDLQKHHILEIGKKHFFFRKRWYQF